MSAKTLMFAAVAIATSTATLGCNQQPTANSLSPVIAPPPQSASPSPPTSPSPSVSASPSPSDVPNYSIGGIMSGLSAAVVLQDNGGDSLTVTSNGAFSFTTGLSNGMSYAVSVFAQPTEQTCSVINGNGTVSGANVSNVLVHCTNNTFSVTPSGAGVTINPNAAQSVYTGTAQSFTVTASAGYTLSTNVGGTCPLGSWNGSVYTTGVITGSCSVAFSAIIDTYSVTQTGNNVSVSPNASMSVNYGASQAFVVTPNAGFALPITVGGTCPAGSWTASGGVYSTGPIFTNCSVSFSSNSAQWADSTSAAINTVAESSFNAVATDSVGNAYAVGWVDNISLGLGNGVMATGTSSSGESALLVKYNSSGTAQWAQAVTGGTTSYFNAVSTDSEGNVYAVGGMNGTGPYGFGNDLTASGSAAQNVVIVKYDSSGVAQWVETFTAGTGGGEFSSVAVDSSGNVYAAGFLVGYQYFGFGNGVTVAGGGASSSTDSALLVKYNSSGVAQWATVASGPSESAFNSVAVDNSGHCYVGGYIGVNGSNKYQFGNGVSASGASAGYTSVLVQYSSAGVAQWIQTDASVISAVVVDSNENIYAAGYHFETGTAFSNQLVLLKFNSSGVSLWGQTVANPPGLSYFYGLAVDGSGNTYAAGTLGGDGTFNFGNNITAAGGTSVLVQYNASGVAQWAQTFPIGDTTSGLTSVSLDGSGNIFAAGVIYGTESYGFGNGTFAAGPGAINAVLVKY